MPELPEVETVARQLAPRLVGRTVRRLIVLDDLLRNGPIPRLRGRRIERVGRAGKQVLVEFSRGSSRTPVWLLVHLRMTGRLMACDETQPLKRAHLRAQLILDRGSLLFVDTRRFGTMHWVRSKEQTVSPGVDPTLPEFTPERLAKLLHGSSQALKVWLLRQDRLVGLGNIYASEVPYSARLSPLRPVDRLTTAEIRRLYQATRRVIGAAIRACGTTFSDFQDARGVEGSYQRFLKVYGREGLRCRRCRGTVRSIVQQQRSSYYCPGCQR